MNYLVAGSVLSGYDYSHSHFKFSCKTTYYCCKANNNAGMAVALSIVIVGRCVEILGPLESY
jgi:hypothetical protein